MKSSRDPLTATELRNILSYDRDTGLFRWKVSRYRVTAGDVAGANHDGYVRICIRQTDYYAHRLAFLYVTGDWPACQHIDHINGNRTDNRWSNLRPASASDNVSNSKTRHDSLSGVKGVYKRGNRFRARIRFHGKTTFLGSFATVDEASAAYMRAATALRGPFANPG